MAVTVEIKTGSRMVMSYLLAPILRYQARKRKGIVRPEKVDVASNRTFGPMVSPITPDHAR
jgi:hypothetical protein